MGNFSLVAVLVYAALFLWFCYRAGRKNQGSLEGFFLANRTLGGVLSALTYSATTYSAFMMVALVGFAYKTGVGALIFELVYLVSTLFLLGFLGPKIWRLGRRHNLVSPFDLLSHKYNSTVTVVASILSLVALIPYTSVQIIGAASILEPFGFSYQTAVVMLTIIVIASSLLGGIRGVALSDALQGVFMFCIALFVFFWSTNRFQLNFAWQSFPNQVWTPAFFVNLTLPWCFFAISNPPVLQRLFMLEDCGKSLRKMLLLFGIFGLFFTLLVTFIGFQASAATAAGNFANVAQGDKVTGQLMSLMPAWLSLALAVSIIIASVTTANSILLTLSSIVSINLLRQERVKGARYSMLIAGIFVALFSFFKGGYIIELSVSSSRYLMVMVPALLMTLTPWKIPAAAALSSILLGLLGAIFAGLSETLSLYSSLIALGSSVIALVAGTWIYHLKLRLTEKA